MTAPLIGGRDGVYLKHSVHGGGQWFPDDPGVLELFQGRGWERADPPVEDDEQPEPVKDSPESPAPKKKTSKAAAAAEKEEVTGG